MKKIISLLIIVFVLCVSFASCGFDDASVKAELIGTWIYKGDTMYFDNGGFYEYESCYVFYPSGNFYYLNVGQYYTSSGAVLGEPRVYEKKGTYKIKKDGIEMTNSSDGKETDMFYSWNAASGKITQLGVGFVKVSNSTDYLDKLTK